MIKETYAGYKEIIEKQGFYIASTVGTSMYPLIKEGIDTVKIVPKVGRCKKYDVVLFQRKNGQYILHRIIKVRRHSYDIRGDNVYHVERHITDDMIIGVVDTIYKGEKPISVTSPVYIDYVNNTLKNLKKRRNRYYFRKILQKLHLIK